MNKLWLRLTVSFLVMTLLVMTMVTMIVRGSVESSFGEYVNVSNMARFGGDLVDDLEVYYATNATWNGAEDLLPSRGGGQGTEAGSSAGQAGRGAQVFIADVEGIIVAATVQDWVGSDLSAIGPSRRIDLHLDGQVVGTLGEQTPGTVALNEAESRFLEETTTGLLLTGVVAGLITFVLGIGLSYSLTRPLQGLTDNISQWRLRDENTAIQVDGTDEIRRLGAAFNDLVGRLAEGEALRQRMSADVAHELRTPVTVMRGHLEAMMDGVYPLDAAHLAVAYDQVLHLARLVEDLRLLTQAEARRLPLNPSIFDMNQLIQAAVERFKPLTQDRNIAVSVHLPPEAASTYADPHRIQQVIDNLLNNAVRHTPHTGQIDIHVTQQVEQVVVSIANQSDTDLTDSQILHLFDRFWRGEESRERDSGGSGLGLAITRELLRLQNGSIRAERNGDGLKLVFVLPAAK